MSTMRWQNIHRRTIRSIVAVLYLCHNCEVAPKFLAEVGLMQAEQEKEQAIRAGTYVMKYIKCMELLVEDVDAGRGHPLPDQQTPHEKTKEKHGKHHCASASSFTATAPYAIRYASEEPEQHIDAAVLPEVVSLPASVIRNCIVLHQREHSNKKKGVSVAHVKYDGNQL